MRLVEKLLGSAPGAAVDETGDGTGSDARGQLADGALDTLGSVIRIMGEESFPLDTAADVAVFAELSRQFAAHVENGAPVPAFDVPRSADGARHWSRVRRFFADRRHAEKQFVTSRLQDYRGVVDELVTGLRQIGERDQETESRVRESLVAVEAAVGQGALPDIKSALAQTLRQITVTFAEQKQLYETQLGELNKRLSNMQQDLVAAREEMQRDALTDAYNRGAFDAAILQSLNLHFLLNQPVTLVMIDLDNFKQVNDGHGHAAGDAVLRAVAECLERAFIRKGDLVARYGGDEFAVILNDTSAANSARLIERFLENAAAIEIADTAANLRVSCSAGYTEIHRGDTVEGAIRRADTALYAAKAAGRNTAKMLLHDADES